MGLDISSKNKSYHGCYHGLHFIRWLALVTCGFPEKICGRPSINYYPIVYIWTNDFPAPPPDEFRKIVHACCHAGYVYPNLILHSDCDGKYTKNGKPATDENWSTGNSKRLLDELKILRKNLPKELKTGEPWRYFQMFFEVVSDCVKNGQDIKFH